jgi:L-fuconolactonase
MSEIATCENVVVKMGGLGSFFFGSPTVGSRPPASSEVLAAEWQPYVQTAVELFGAQRVMVESNLPADGPGAVNVVCNAYKRIVANCSEVKRRQIFAKTAATAYRLDTDGTAARRNALISPPQISRAQHRRGAPTELA